MSFLVTDESGARNGVNLQRHSVTQREFQILDSASHTVLEKPVSDLGVPPVQGVDKPGSTGRLCIRPPALP